MAKQAPKKESSAEEQALDGFEIHINEFGEIVSNRRLEDVNKFLDEHVPDKKLSSAEEKAADLPGSVGKTPSDGTDAEGLAEEENGRTDA
ncbi:MAG: hypothetical protein RLY31_850 [Bacteroidota bacterium]|jgi:hypothetical protein